MSISKIKSNEIYLDNNSTTKPYKQVVSAMNKVQEQYYGNPSTSYKIGKSAKDVIETSRKSMSTLLGIRDPCHLIFTSGASESNNNMIRGCILNCVNKSQSQSRKLPKILCSAIEHSSVYETCENLHNQHSCNLEIIPVDKYGFIQEDVYSNMIDENTKLVCIMIANNELGTIQNIKKLVQILRKKQKNCFFLCNATQYIGKYPINFNQLGVDGISFSAHKFHGPRGIGCMYLKNTKSILSCNTGGHQEYDLRAGTENTASIYGMAMALEISTNNFQKDVTKTYKLRNKMEDYLLQHIPGSNINCPFRDIHKRMYSVISITFPRNIDSLLTKLNQNNIYLNVGSACNKGIKSRLLSAIGLKNENVKRTVRISLSTLNTESECMFAIHKIVSILMGT